MVELRPLSSRTYSDRSMGGPLGVVLKDEPFDIWSRWQANEMDSMRQEASGSSTQGRIV